MQVSDAESDYLIELFNVALEEVAERVAVITERPVTIATPTLLPSPSNTQWTRYLSPEADAFGYLAILPLTQEFDGFGLMFIDKAQGEKFARLLSDSDNGEYALNSLQELARVLLEQYAVVLTDLLSLTIDYGSLDFGQSSLIECLPLSSACRDGALGIVMSFALSDGDITCHIVVVHRQPVSALLNVIKAALADLGLT